MGLTVAGVLGLSVHDALERFADQASVVAALWPVSEVGLGYPRQDHIRPLRRRFPARRNGRTHLLRLHRVALLLAAEHRNAGRAVVLPIENPNHLQELHQAASVSAAAATLHCEVLISETIITPGSAMGQTLAPAGLRCAISPNAKRANPGEPDQSWPLGQRCSNACP
jgi:hypothetical protein